MPERPDSLRVLIVEDEPHIVESLSFILQREGYAVSAAGDGETALGLLRASPPGLLLLDLMLPGISGFEVLKTVRSDPALATIPVVVLTAKGQARDRRMAEDIGVDGFVTKPFSNRELVELVRALVRS
jgi:DNA-binding response OmpR family regulator